MLLDSDDETRITSEDASASFEEDGDIDTLLAAVEELPDLQKAIVKADLAAGGPGAADASRLAMLHGTTKNSVYASRNKAVDNLKKEFARLSQVPSKKGKSNARRS
jgi:hypothetical protein